MSDTNLPEQATPGGHLELPETWHLSEKAKKALELARKHRRTRHGLFSSVPLICKGPECPYAATCPLYQADLAPLDERCPLEIAMIEERFEAYTTALKVNPEDVVDLTLLRDLINAEIVIERCDKLIAESGSMIQDVIATVTTKTETPYYRPEIHKALEIRERYEKRKDTLLQLLNSTRKDQMRVAELEITASAYAAKIREKYEKELGPVVEAEYWEKAVEEAKKHVKEKESEGDAS